MPRADSPGVFEGADRVTPTEKCRTAYSASGSERAGPFDCRRPRPRVRRLTRGRTEDLHMNRRGWVLAAVALLASAAGSWADVARSPAADVTPRLRFDNLTDYPEHDFYLKYGRSPGNPYAAGYLPKVEP